PTVWNAITWYEYVLPSVAVASKYSGAVVVAITLKADSSPSLRSTRKWPPAAFQEIRMPLGSGVSATSVGLGSGAITGTTTSFDHCDGLPLSPAARAAITTSFPAHSAAGIV